MKFREKVYKVVNSIPEGMVATYGQIATMIGSPRASRQVGFALRALGLNEENIPWWRVVNRKGYISINHGDGGVEKLIQKDLLENEGVRFLDELTVDLEVHLWRPAE